LRGRRLVMQLRREDDDGYWALRGRRLVMQLRLEDDDGYWAVLASKARIDIILVAAMNVS
jgi:hypothetical protein